MQGIPEVPLPELQSCYISRLRGDMSLEPKFRRYISYLIAHIASEQVSIGCVTYFCFSLEIYYTTFAPLPQ